MYTLQISRILVIAAFLSGSLSAQDSQAETESWRIARENNLLADNGWLTVAGLFFLTEGTNHFGSSPANDIVLRYGPEHAGTFTLKNNEITVHAPNGERLSVNGQKVETAKLWPYSANNAPTINIGPLSLFAHYSGNRLAIRLRDQASSTRTNFQGLRWFPVDPSYRVKGRYIQRETPVELKLPNILGDVELFQSSGMVELTIDENELRMSVIDAGDKLWFIFRDMTSGKETYPAARFLYADSPEDGITFVDFNRAYNPPCAFNPYTTCPLPPLENRLPVRIEAGEMDYHSSQK